MEFLRHTLSNGIRIIHKQYEDADVSHCGLIINAGTRDEEEDQQGLAHFIEHVVFKGTKKRKSFHILNRIDSVGGELNAYTSKEETCIYASFLNRYYDRAIELLQDITFNSIFPDKEIEKEKDVIIDEINSYQDNPSEQIFDDFEDLVFAGHPIGRNILGTEQSVRQFKRRDINSFITKNYTTDEIVLSSAGNIDFAKLVEICENYLGTVKKTTRNFKRAPVKNYKPKVIESARDTFQAHCMLGSPAQSVKNSDKTAMILLNNMLGGPAMNSRLNLSIREKYGFTYNLESNYTAYTDTGIFNIYLATDNKTLEKCLKLIRKELKKLREQKLGTMQLNNAKLQLIGHIALSQESRINTMLAAGKSLLIFDRVESLEKIYKKIETISSEKLLDISNQVFDERHLSRLTYLAKQ